MAERVVGFGVVVGLVVVIVVLAGGMGYLLYNERSLNASSQSITSMNKEIASQNATISEQSSTISSLESELNGTVASLQSEINQLKSLISSLENNTNSSSQNKSNSTVPLSATLQEQSEYSNTATLVLSYTAPSNMTSLSSIGMTLATPGSPPVYYSFGALSYWSSHGTIIANSTTGLFSVIFTNPNGNAHSYIQSGSIITIIYNGGSTYTWSGVTFALSYEGYSGAVSVTLP